MATFEERLTSLEQEQADLKHDNEELKQKVELHTIALGGMVNKALLERLNEKNDKIFEALQNHDSFTNVQLAELRDQQTQLDGKIVAVQTEMRQRFNAVETRLENTATKDDLKAIDARFDQIMLALAALTPKPEREP